MTTPPPQPSKQDIEEALERLLKKVEEEVMLQGKLMKEPPGAPAPTQNGDEYAREVLGKFSTQLWDYVTFRLDLPPLTEESENNVAVKAVVNYFRYRGRWIIAVPQNGDAWRGSGLYYALARLWDAAEGNDRSIALDEVLEAQQAIAEAFVCPIGASAYTVPDHWWETGIGRVCRLARAVIEGDPNLCRFEELAEQAGVSVDDLARLLGGKTTLAMTDEAEVVARKLEAERRVKEWQL